MKERRYERLRPAQILELRQACPVAYIALGNLEWHGEHNPVGLDTLRMNGVLLRCAEKTGGLVFPPLYYGDNREQALMEANAADRERIHRRMGLASSNFTAGYMCRSIYEQTDIYHRLLIHILFEIASLGFKVIVIGAGHYPLIDHARAAICIAHQTLQRQRKAVMWAFTGYELVKDIFPFAGDHGGKWETSMIMALEPGLTDLSALSAAPGAAPVGISDNGVEESSAEEGEKFIAAIVESASDRVTDMLQNFDAYLGHGARF
ncbi:creatininase family protein [candidate division KSB1 bacterium]|nr:creatininase family protein [candidate division KSB1 bacterium]